MEVLCYENGVHPLTSGVAMVVGRKGQRVWLRAGGAMPSQLTGLGTVKPAYSDISYNDNPFIAI